MKSRRIFIKHSLGSIAAAAVANSAFASVLLPRKKEKLGVALVGLGYYSTDLLAPALQLTKHCELKGIVTGTPEKAKKWQAQYRIADKNIYDYKSFDQLANNPDIDVVYIVLPPSMHAAYAIRAARAGKHVWCEKPMAMTVAECKSMIDACNSNKVKLSIGYRLHHEPVTQQIIQFGKEKRYGAIRKVTAFAGYVDNRTNHWKQTKSLGGGCMYDMGVYPLNAARYITGEEPVAVTAKQSTTRPEIYKDVDETIHFNLEFPSGALAECEASFGKDMNHMKTECTKGWYKLEPFSAYNGVQGTASDGLVIKPAITEIPYEQVKQMDEDALAIMQNKTVLVPGEEGLRDIRVVEAIYSAVRQNTRIAIA
ncbi:Gfo/Idh/MocA family oxidoreductase [Panacibacter sp. DH6]|uniref:Gfo/Idh/MocA family oxidoreductase n=1 Tax=Panacibacter microcysteis TaxID=2793269 RepID=A0A931E6X2_9BACT|nr:Gfo/Idh/MocA family oxidoreductase [Panacibacter microcysteis]MBG9377297.1 Gfo/Idh/MocA family oxidoreductase [Panacibacter microcysteis]